MTCDVREREERLHAAREAQRGCCTRRRRRRRPAQPSNRRDPPRSRPAVMRRLEPPEAHVEARDEGDPIEHLLDPRPPRKTPLGASSTSPSPLTPSCSAGRRCDGREGPPGRRRRSRGARCRRCTPGPRARRRASCPGGTRRRARSSSRDVMAQPPPVGPEEPDAVLLDERVLVRPDVVTVARRPGRGGRPRGRRPGTRSREAHERVEEHASHSAGASTTSSSSSTR